MTNPPIPQLPLPDDDRVADDGVSEPAGEPAIVDDEGERTIDPDVDGDRVDSAEADRLAAGAQPEEGAL